MDNKPLCGNCRWNSPSACRNQNRPDAQECSDYLSIEGPGVPSEARAWVGNQYFDPADGQWKSETRQGGPRKRMLLAGVIVALLAIAAGGCAYILFSGARFEAPSGFRATAGQMKIILEWNAVSGGEAVRVVCRTTGYPTAPDSGLVIYEGSDSGCVHGDVEYGTTYYYGIWAVRYVEGSLEYSASGRFDSATPVWVGPDGEELHEYVETAPNTRVVGADGEYIELWNNPEASDPTWEELLEFLQEDRTDLVVYDTDSFVCADFAEMLHNNAEKAGIRAAYVHVEFVGESVGHALNAFKTDKGLVYIDDTGTEISFPCSADKTVTLRVGREYVPESIFPCTGYSSTWESLGVVSRFRVVW